MSEGLCWKCEENLTFQEKAVYKGKETVWWHCHHEPKEKPKECDHQWGKWQDTFNGDFLMYRECRVCRTVEFGRWMKISQLEVKP